MMNIFKEIGTQAWNYYALLTTYMLGSYSSDIMDLCYSKFCELHNAFTLALAFLILKFILIRYLYTPIGCYFGIKSKPAKTVNDDGVENKVLEKAFRENKKMDNKQIQGLAKQLDWSERKVQRWIRRRLALGRTPILRKFAESAWNFTSYLIAFCYGLYVMWDKSWVWKTENCWRDYPHHKVTNDIWWYYMMELGFYLTLIPAHFTDTKRKDSLQMLIHHIVAIILLTLTWTWNIFRLGTLTILIFEFSHVSLEVSKVAFYLKYQRAADSCFVAFAIGWVITSFILYPYMILYTTLYEIRYNFSLIPGYYLCNSLLCSVLILRLIWSRMIVQTAVLAVSSKKGVRDVRSDTEVSDTGSSENEADAKILPES